MIVVNINIVIAFKKYLYDTCHFLACEFSPIILNFVICMNSIKNVNLSNNLKIKKNI